MLVAELCAVTAPRAPPALVNAMAVCDFTLASYRTAARPDGHQHCGLASRPELFFVIIIMAPASQL